MKQVHIYQKIKPINPTGIKFIIYLFLFYFLYYREQLNKQINDAEARIRSNRDKQKVTKDVQIDGSKQLKYWRDLLRMMELKRKLATVELENIFIQNLFIFIFILG
jgi:hypothetical protein